MKNNRLKLFIKNKFYRYFILDSLKLDFLRLPGIRTLHAYYMVCKERNLDNWEKHVKYRNAINRSNKFQFYLDLVCLNASIESKNASMEWFCESKEKVLSNNYIKESSLRDFKIWVENLKFDETDLSPLKKVLDNLKSELL